MDYFAVTDFPWWLQVVENVERETGIEPAANSLEGRP